MVCTWPRSVDRRRPWQTSARVSFRIFWMSAATAPRSRPCVGGIEVDDRLHVVVRHDRGARCCGEMVAEAPSNWSDLPFGDRQVLQLRRAVDPVLRRLDDDRIGHPVVRVEPEGRRRLAAAGERRQQAGRRRRAR